MQKQRLISLFFIPFFISCAGDIKGDPGPAVNGRKPAYQQLSGGATQVVIPASVQKPAKVAIDGKIFINTSDITCDLTQGGRNGLDVGNLQAGHFLYLYAIPGTSGTTFDSVASTNSPLSGPTGFSSWSYLGAFSIDNNKTVVPFQIVNGSFFYNTFVKIVAIDTSQPPAPPPPKYPNKYL
jgi:hypothetical protein